VKPEDDIVGNSRIPKKFTLGILNFSARNSKRGKSSCVSLVSLDEVELLFCWGILDVFFGVMGYFLRKFYLGILEF
ncbi:MAG: hypothetical protein SOU37_01720, partial [Campylobacter lanienae]|nr:hypothetical protein [Campylobacteraceae bacterium]MDY2817319.1 hypothetical protein [Campylobacter lanienae]